MKKDLKQKILTSIILLMGLILSALSFANSEIQPSVTPQLSEKARTNSNWKQAFITGKHAQIVFMNVSPTLIQKMKLEWKHIHSTKLL